MNPLDRNLQDLRRIARDLMQTAPAEQPQITLGLVRKATMHVADICELLAEDLERLWERTEPKKRLAATRRDHQ